MTMPMQWALRRRMMMAATGIDVAALAISYTGVYQDYGVVQMNDGDYRLLAFTSSGTLTIDKPVNCEVCVVGGGANGNAEGDYGAGNISCGGAGAYMKNQVIEAFDGGAVVVGAAQGASSIGGVSVSAISGKNGGTGAGVTSYWYPGTGDGLSKYPFNDDSYSLWIGKPHCAGGAGGGEALRTQDQFGHDKYDRCQGGNGGTNGANGGIKQELDTTSSSNTPGGSGGSYGGGNGGAVASSISKGENATYYGSGAGGGGYYQYYGENSNTLAGGVGYQGIVYARIPVNQ